MQGVTLRLVQWVVVFVADLEQVLGALAEGRDARVVHAQAALAQHPADVGEQAGAVGAGQAELGTSLFGVGDHLDVRKEIRRVLNLVHDDGRGVGPEERPRFLDRRLTLMSPRFTKNGLARRQKPQNVRCKRPALRRAQEQIRAATTTAAPVRDDSNYLLSPVFR